MISRMNTVQNAARLAMGDYRSGEPLLDEKRRGSARSYRIGIILLTLAALVAISVFVG